MCKTDVGGGYVWNSVASRWDQVITTLSMPAADVGPVEGSGAGLGYGIWEIAVAPSNTNVCYMVWRGYTYRTNDRCATWTKLDQFPRLAQSGTFDGSANGPTRLTNQKLIIDPLDEDIVYVSVPVSGADCGVWRSFNGGVTTEHVTSITAPTAGPGNAGMIFDSSGGSTGGRTNNIYIPSTGNGVWFSSDAGVTWTQIADGVGLGGPTAVRGATTTPGGMYIPIDATKVWKYSASTWTSPHINASSENAVAADPNSDGRVVMTADSGIKSGKETLNGFTSFVTSGGGSSVWFPNFPAPGSNAVATDIPYLATLGNSGNEYMPSVCMAFDPTESNKLYAAQGVGVWYGSWPTTFTAFDWTSQSAGIEELVTNDIVAGAGSNPMVAVWDRGVFNIPDPDAYATQYGPVDGEFVAGWQVDYVSNDPSKTVALVNWGSTYRSGIYSGTWTQFPTQPYTGGIGGCIAAATTSNIIMCPANGASGKVPRYTKDGGATWADVPGLPASNWIISNLFNRRMIAADRVNIGTFYIYNWGTGLYETTDGGDSTTLVFSGEICPTSSGQAKLRAAPNAGDLWFTSSRIDGSGHPYASGFFKRSTNGGRSWTTIPNVLEVRTFGFGKGRSTGYVVYIVGWVNGVYGIWLSYDYASSWVNIGDFPNNNFDYPTTINGDMDIVGRVYVGFSGTGAAYGDFSELIPSDISSTIITNPGGAGAPLRRRPKYESYNTIVRRQKIREIEELKAAILARGTVAPRMAEKVQEFIPYNDGMSIRALVADLARAQQELEDEEDMIILALLH